ncbi:MAG: succinate dehydrogenase assembly factor 2 [Gammaproteobacteria bacterium]|jgi:antitoxin CptB|nr:succinate dehydrogenase assembly factor 2 [Gammaproteobacteria bacterium]
MSQTNPVSASQLHWRCRRGMLELDLLLNAFVEMQYSHLSREDTALFLSLLEYPDQVLLDLLLGKMESSDAMVSDLAARIRRTWFDKFNCAKTT